MITTLITGAMNAGKSREMINCFLTDDRLKMVLKPSSDTRDGAYIRSRAGVTTIQAIIVDESNQSIVDSVMIGMSVVDVVYIDEVQMFSVPFLNLLMNQAKNLDVDVIASGLTHGYMHKPFPSTVVIASKADHIKMLASKCEVCKDDIAYYTVRIDENGHMVIFGDQNDPHAPKHTYKSVCKGCHNKGAAESYLKWWNS